MIEYKQVSITPAWAGEVLDEHWRRIEKGQFAQRSITLGKVAQYAMEMQNDNWKLSPQSIDFDVDGNLINGQHRLEAVRRSGVTIKQMVSTGWPMGTMAVMDQGKARSLAQLLGLDGNKNCANLAAAITAICRIPFRGATVSLTYAQTGYILNKLGLETSIHAIYNKASGANDMQGRVVGPLAYYHTVHPRKSTDFAESLFNCETSKGSPVALYLKWIHQGSHKKLGKEGHLRGLCACLRAWHEDRTIEVIRSSPEAVQWLADLNPKLRDWIRKHIPRSGRLGMGQIMNKDVVVKPAGNGNKK